MFAFWSFSQTVRSNDSYLNLTFIFLLNDKKFWFQTAYIHFLKHSLMVIKLQKCCTCLDLVIILIVMWCKTSTVRALCKSAGMPCYREFREFRGVPCKYSNVSELLFSSWDERASMKRTLLDGQDYRHKWLLWRHCRRDWEICSLWRLCRRTSLVMRTFGNMRQVERNKQATIRFFMLALGRYCKKL